MSRGKHFLYDGVWDTMYGHARRLGISTKTVDVRIMRYGNTPENYWRILHVGRLGAIMMTYNGIHDSCEGWARRFGVRLAAIRRRFPDGVMTDERVAALLRRKHGEGHANDRARTFLTYRGETHTIDGWARIIGHSKGCIRDRIRRGLPLRMVLAKKNHRHRVPQFPEVSGVRERILTRKKELKSLGIIV